MKAAVLYERNTSLVVEEIDLDGPKPGEVLVKIVATGVCCSDLHVINGDIPAPLPIVLGHEGAGIVEKVGEGVTTVQPGDHVVLSAVSSCGKCKSCIIGKPYLCEAAWPAIFKGTMLDGTKRLRKGDQEIHHFLAQSSFAEYVVVSERTAVKVRKDAPLDKVALFSDGASAGVGAVLKTARVEAGSSVAIFGCGGVGLSAVMAAHLVGANPIIAVDILENKLTLARDLGATHTINPVRETPVERIQELTNGGADYAFECIGKVEIMTQAFDAIRPGGKAVIIGVAPPGARMSINPKAFLSEKTLTGSSVGSMQPSVDIPSYVNLYMAGRLPVDRLVSRTYTLEEINQAFEAMKKGEVIRSVITFE